MSMTHSPSSSMCSECVRSNQLQFFDGGCEVVNGLQMVPDSYLRGFPVFIAHEQVVIVDGETLDVPDKMARTAVIYPGCAVSFIINGQDTLSEKRLHDEMPREPLIVQLKPI